LIVSGIEDEVRRRAYELWEHAGRPEGRSDEFWFAASVELQGEQAASLEQLGALVPPLDEPPAVAVQHGVPVGMPGERIVEQGVMNDRLEEQLLPPASKAIDD
jgi:hypothetical protein